jgi:hypothetical protein
LSGVDPAGETAAGDAVAGSFVQSARSGLKRLEYDLLLRWFVEIVDDAA